MNMRFGVLVSHRCLRLRGCCSSAKALFRNNRKASAKRRARAALCKGVRNLGVPCLEERLFVVSPPNLSNLTELF